MRLNYKQLGQYIEPVNIRNKDLSVETLLGVSIQKCFMPSIANTVGTDMSKYKVVKRNQFAYGPVTSRNGDKISVALLEDFDSAIISQAYVVFQVIDQDQLDPEYLMMWFRRPEFDRYARFMSHGSARETFDWEEMCEVELPVPSIEKQREIVKEYNTIVNRIKLNEELNQKLEETAQALYKHWFVDFEFPNEEGKPYKSSGGKMVYNEEMEKEIPANFQVKELNSICDKITKGTTPQFMSEDKTEDTPISYIKGESIKENHHFDVDKISYIENVTHLTELKRSHLMENDICYSIAGSLDKFTIVDSEIIPANTNQAIAIIRTNQNVLPYQYLYGFFISQMQKEFYTLNVQQAVQANLSLTTIGLLPVLIPNQSVLTKIKEYMEIWLNNRNTIASLNRRLDKLKSLILSKMSNVESVKKEVI
jgi:type I restriction enzyme S subunit